MLLKRPRRTRAGRADHTVFEQICSQPSGYEIARTARPATAYVTDGRAVERTALREFAAARTMESTHMPRRTEAPSTPAEERCREVAAILARGVLRLRRIARIGVHLHAQESQDLRENGLELPGETRLSVVNGTRGLRLRDEGDNA